MLEDERNVKSHARKNRQQISNFLRWHVMENKTGGVASP